MLDWKQEIEYIREKNLLYTTQDVVKDRATFMTFLAVFIKAHGRGLRIRSTEVSTGYKVTYYGIKYT